MDKIGTQRQEAGRSPLLYQAGREERGKEGRLCLRMALWRKGSADVPRGKCSRKKGKPSRLWATIGKEPWNLHHIKIWTWTRTWIRTMNAVDLLSTFQTLASFKLGEVSLKGYERELTGLWQPIDHSDVTIFPFWSLNNDTFLFSHCDVMQISVEWLELCMHKRRKGSYALDLTVVKRRGRASFTLLKSRFLYC